jgi:hypothetical protein
MIEQPFYPNLLFMKAAFVSKKQAFAFAGEGLIP